MPSRHRRKPTWTQVPTRLTDATREFQKPYEDGLGLFKVGWNRASRPWDRGMLKPSRKFAATLNSIRLYSRSRGRLERRRTSHGYPGEQALEGGPHRADALGPQSPDIRGLPARQTERSPLHAGWRSRRVHLRRGWTLPPPPLLVRRRSLVCSFTQNRLLPPGWRDWNNRTHLMRLRQKLGDDAANPTYIFSEPRVVYRMAVGETAEG